MKKEREAQSCQWLLMPLLLVAFSQLSLAELCLYVQFCVSKNNKIALSSVVSDIPNGFVISHLNSLNLIFLADAL